ncbi:MAG: DNA double-strand break repair nuclease NurA [Thaumarchaeota archaeon]|nr:DNA double-strand break repair nuclease NurA [Candidatus Calditenuaceae archaeon]MDW8041676.1 DNA double-strand break repair nuclease NurA [Nitrososphaerota archaeon]
MGAEEDLPDLQKIPKPLQERYYDLARREVESILNYLTKVDVEFLKPFEDLVKRARRGLNRVEWKERTFAVVDGSDTPAIDERIGVKYGLSTAGVKAFRGLEPLEDGELYVGDMLKGSVNDSKEEFLKKLDLVTTYLERALALRALEEADYVVIDGSFFGFRAGCSRVKTKSLNWVDPVSRREFKSVYGLIEELLRSTEKLLDSGRAFGIVKRVPTSALDGLIGYTYGPGRMLGLSDRSILLLTTSPGDVIAYSEIFPEGYYHDVFSLFCSQMEEYVRKGRSVDVERALKGAERRFRLQVVSDLGRHRDDKRSDELIRLISSTERVFVRTVEAQPPVCLELPRGAGSDLKDIAITYVLESHNPATGLPLALDVVDDLVSLPRRVGTEFVDEIEAELLRRNVDLRRMRAVFSKINPQKEFE